MAIPTFTTAEPDRKFDLEVMPTVDGSSLALFQLELGVTGQDTTRRLTGLQKLVQRYSLLFLQFRGSVKYAPTQGTRFLPAVYAGRIQTAEHIAHQFVFANVAVLDQLQFDDTAPEFGRSPPADERIAAASLLEYNVDLQNARLLLRIGITNSVGDSATFILPTN